MMCMVRRTSLRSRLRRSKALVLFAICVAGLALAGCDKCGDFVWNKPGACRDYGPPQR